MATINRNDWPRSIGIGGHHQSEKSTKQVDYESYPVAVKLKLAPKTIQKLSWNGSDDPVKIYLYDDGCIPTDSTKHMTAYLDKIALLAKVKVG